MRPYSSAMEKPPLHVNAGWFAKNHRFPFPDSEGRERTYETEYSQAIQEQQFGQVPAVQVIHLAHHHPLALVPGSRQVAHVGMGLNRGVKDRSVAGW